MTLTRRSFALAGAASALAAPALGQVAAQQVPTQWMPRMVTLETPLPEYEIHVDPDLFALFWTLPNNRAVRYTCGIGREELYETGEFYIGAKKEWPSWTPTPDMIEREPEKYEQYKDGMEGGPENPLGARALYLFVPGVGDTFLRIHGTNLPGTIGSRVSNGCVRLVNSHIQHLYEQVPVNTRVVLY